MGLLLDRFSVLVVGVCLSRVKLVVFGFCGFAV